MDNDMKATDQKITWNDNIGMTKRNNMVCSLVL